MFECVKRLHVFVFFFLWVGLYSGNSMAIQGLSVSPAALSKKSTFILNLPKGHPSKFAIETPDKQWVYLVDEDNLINFIEPEAFSNTDKFEMIVKDVKGVIYDGHGGLIEKKVFVKSGKYRFYFASDLGTEPENTDAIEIYVQYVNE